MRKPTVLARRLSIRSNPGDFLSLDVNQTARKVDFADFKRAIEKGTNETVARYTRGNVLAQSGVIMDTRSLSQLGEAGDIAAAKLLEILKREND